LASLRLARTLQTGFAVTAEPGIYFVPELIAAWRRAGRLCEFIDYDQVETFVGMGGIRIEDDLWVTANGCTVLSAAIPKEIDDIEGRLHTGRQ
jgi:Xaa-Pro aminopeptidase